MSFWLCVSANQGNKTHTKRLPPIDKVSDVWRFLEKSLEELGCCENLFASQPLHGFCAQCNREKKTGSDFKSKWVVLACFLYKIYGIFRRCMYYIYNRKMVCSGMGELLQIQHVTIVINHQVL